MLRRFELYGFLKNQRYFEPFLVLVLLDRGLSFAALGWLVMARELTVNLVEVPSGALADIWGRRATLQLAFACYIVAFVALGTVRQLPVTFAAVLLIAAGDALRSGTHKALILAWLRREGRIEERTRVYGLTRSWSKIGSAVSVPIGALIVLLTGRFEPAFLATVPLYLAAVVNLLGYPAAIDLPARERLSTGDLLAHMRETLARAWSRRPLRRVLAESMGFHGTFGAVEDYLQPALLALAAGSGAALAAGGPPVEIARIVYVAAPVYLVLALVAGVASRQAHRWVRAAGGEAGAALSLWLAALAGYALMLAGGALGRFALVVAAFVVLHALQNVWRPVMVARLDRGSLEGQAATLLSIDSQVRRLVTMVLAPILGTVIEALRSGGSARLFWPLGLVGVIVALGFLLTRPRGSSAEPA